MIKSVTIAVDAGSPNGVQAGLGGPVVAPGNSQTVTVPYHGMGVFPANGGPATWTLSNAGSDPVDVATTSRAPLPVAGSVSYSAKETIAIRIRYQKKIT